MKECFLKGAGGEPMSVQFILLWRSSRSEHSLGHGTGTKSKFTKIRLSVYGGEPSMGGENFRLGPTMKVWYHCSQFGSANSATLK